MRQTRPLAAILVAIILSLSPQSGLPDIADRSTLQDMFDYASGFNANGDSLRATIVYDLMLRAFSQADNQENLRATCEKLVEQISTDDIDHFNLSFWNCPERLLIDWLGDIEPYRSLEPSLLTASPPEFPAGTEVPEGSVVLEFDITSSGDVEHVTVIESSHEIWEASAIEAMKKFKFSPARYNGEAVEKTGVVHKFSFRFE